jgi:hypothetical protein
MRTKTDSLPPDSVTNEIRPRDAQKEWRSPVLRSLPIVATASSSKPDGNSNDGGAGGKGEVANPATIS